MNSFLAFAARCTSSFPFAFEPMRLTDIDAVLDSVPDWEDQKHPWCRSDDPKLEEFFQDYILAAENAAAAPADDAARRQARLNSYVGRAFGDGGYLNNKPFSHAIEALARRTTGLPVRRKVAYIEPSPDDPAGNKTKAPPNFIENALAAGVTLHQYETIREDLQRLLTRNRLIDRAAEVVVGVEDDVAAWPRPGRATGERYETRTLTQEIKVRGPSYGGYHRLKVKSVTDHLAGIVTRAAGRKEDSDEFEAIRYVVGRWRDRRYSENDPAKIRQTRFLLEFDLDYRQRRLRFLLTKLEEVYALEGSTQPAWPAGVVKGAVDQPALDALANFHREILDVRLALKNAAHDLICLKLETELRGERNPMCNFVKLIGIDSEWLKKLITTASQDERRAKVEAFLDQAHGTIDTLSEKIALWFGGVTIAASLKAEAALAGNSPLKQWLRNYFENYEDYDQVLFPIFYETAVGEAEPADVIRISPQDATSVVNEKHDGRHRRKLAGIVLFHFGAFFDQLWRGNDMLWGRMDGAERIICSLIPDSQMRAGLIREAHFAIIEEEMRPQEQGHIKNLLVTAILSLPRGQRTPERLRSLLEAELGAPVDSKVDAVFTACLNTEQIYDYLRDDYEVDRHFSPVYTLDIIGRSTQITGKMLEQVAASSDSSKIPVSASKGTAWIARLGAVFWGLVQVAVPGGLGRRVFRHWLKLLYFFEALLLLGSTLALSSSTQQFAITSLVVTVSAHLLVTALGDVMRGKRLLWRIPVIFILCLAVGLMGVGAYTVWHDIWPVVLKHIGELIPWAHPTKPKT